jgi:hypothetical protein
LINRDLSDFVILVIHNCREWDHGCVRSIRNFNMTGIIARYESQNLVVAVVNIKLQACGCSYNCHCRVRAFFPQVALLIHMSFLGSHDLAG